MITVMPTPHFGLVSIFYAWAVLAANATPSNNRLNSFIKHHEAISINPSHAKHQHNMFRRGIDSHFQIEFNSHNRLFDMRLGLHHGLLHPGFEAVAHHADGSKTRLHVDQSRFLQGHLKGEENSSRVNMVVSEEGILEGTIAVGGEIYRLKPAKKWYKNNDKITNIVYNTKDIDVTGGNKEHIGTCGVKSHEGDSAHYSHDDILHFETEIPKRHRRSAYDSSRSEKVCGMYLICDYDFYSDSEFGNNNAQTATAKIMQYLSDASAIYQHTTFDINVGPIQLAAKKIVILDSPTSPAGATPYPFNQCSATSAECFLDELSSIQENSNDGGLDGAYCLAHAFTTRDFSGGVLGLAYTGSGSSTGACSTYSSSSSQGYATRYAFNTGITTTKNLGKTNVYDQTMIVFAHEVGHNFGMRHDNDCAQTPVAGPYSLPSPWTRQPYCRNGGSSGIAGEGSEPGSCRGTEYVGGSNGNHIMWPASVDGTMPNHNDFSFCSTNYAGNFIYQYANQDNCFQTLESLQGGNNIVESDEVCDCDRNNETFTSLTNGQSAVCPFDRSCKLTKNSNGFVPSLVDGFECSPSAGPCCNDGCSDGYTWDMTGRCVSGENSREPDTSGYGTFIGFDTIANLKAFFVEVQASRSNRYVNPDTCSSSTITKNTGTNFFEVSASSKQLTPSDSSNSLPKYRLNSGTEFLRACGAETDCTWPLMCVNTSEFKGRCPNPSNDGVNATAFYKGDQAYYRGNSDFSSHQETFSPECGFSTSTCDQYTNGAVCKAAGNLYTCSSSVCSLYPTVYGIDGNSDGMPDDLNAMSNFPAPSQGLNSPTTFKNGPAEACTTAGSAVVGCRIMSYCHHIKSMYNVTDTADMPDLCKWNPASGLFENGNDGRFDPVGVDYSGRTACPYVGSSCNSNNCIDQDNDNQPDVLDSCMGSCISTAHLTSSSSQYSAYVDKFKGQKTDSTSSNKLSQSIFSPAADGWRQYCLPDNYGCVLSNGVSGIVQGCQCVERSDSAVITTTNVLGWVGENWWIVVVSTLGAVVLAFVIRALDRKDPTIFKGIKGIARGEKGNKNDKKGASQKALMDLENKHMQEKAKKGRYHHRAGRAAKQSTRITMELKDQHGLTLKEGEDPSRAHGMALRRLMRLFPTARPDTLNVVIRHTPHEDAAVRQLIRLGYGMEKISFIDPLLSPKIKAKKHLGENPVVSRA